MFQLFEPVYADVISPRQEAAFNIGSLLIIGVLVLLAILFFRAITKNKNEPSK